MRLGNQRGKLPEWALGATLALATATLVAGCGADGEEESGPSAITISQSAAPDSLDPAMTFSVNVWEAEWLVYTPLLTYRHEEGEAGSELIPGVADKLPEVSDDGLTYTLTMRDDLTYSDGTPAVASDFEHTLKRVFVLQSPGTSFFEGIDGVEEFLEADDPQADISGIEADDETGVITIELTAVDPSFANLLAMNFVGLVPSDTPFEEQSRKPPPGIGAYEITSTVPNREFTLERVEGFGELDITDVPEGSIETITTKIVGNASRQAQDVLDGELDYMQDPPPADLLPTVEADAADRYEDHPTISTYYFFLNTEAEPFDDPRVREAVNIGLDRPALARLYGGLLAPGCAFIPPGMPGYDEALDTTECPWGDPNAAGDVKAAQELIEAAGAEGEPVQVWAPTDDPSPKVATAVADQLSEIGLDAKPNVVGGATYFGTVGNEKTEAQVGFVSYFQDYPHPLSFFGPVFGGGSITPRNNANLSNVDDEFVNSEIERLTGEPDLTAVAGEWSELDRHVIENAYIAPYGHRRLTTFFSERMNPEAAIFHPNYGNDYSSWELE